MGAVTVTCLCLGLACTLAQCPTVKDLVSCPYLPTNLTDNCPNAPVFCPFNCLTCSDITTCTQCYDGNYIQPDNTCDLTCPENFYPDNNPPVSCLPCIANCK